MRGALREAVRSGDEALCWLRGVFVGLICCILAAASQQMTNRRGQVLELLLLERPLHTRRPVMHSIVGGWPWTGATWATY